MSCEILQMKMLEKYWKNLNTNPQHNLKIGKGKRVILILQAQRLTEVVSLKCLVLSPIPLSLFHPPGLYLAQAARGAGGVTAPGGAQEEGRCCT